MGLLPAFLEAQRGALGIDPDASPSFEGVLEVRHKQMLRLRDFLEAVEPAELRANQRGKTTACIRRPRTTPCSSAST